MNKKKFILYQIKINLPILIIFASFATLLPLINVALSNITIEESSNNNIDSFIIFMSLVPYIFAFIYPLTIFSYRYYRPTVDFFYQMAVDKRFTKRVKILIGLFSSIGVLLITYLLSFIILFIRYNALLSLGKTLVNINFSAFFIALPFIVLSLVATYSISLFCASLGNNQKDKFLLWFFSNVILFMFFTSISTYLLFIVSSLIAFQDYDVLINPLICSLSPLSIISIVSNTFSYLLVNGSWFSFASLSSILSLVFFILIIGFAVFSFIYTFNSKEKRGEFATINGSYNLLTYIIPHVAFLNVGIYITTTWSLGWSLIFYLPSIIFFAVYFVGYYFALVWYYKKLKMDKKNFLFYFINVGTVIALSIIICYFTFFRLF